MGLKVCCECEAQYPQKSLKRIQKQWLCFSCAREIRLEKREFIKRAVVGIRKREDLMAEWKAKRENKVPKMQGEKARVKTRNNNYLSFVEKQVLYKKYIRMGMDSEEADKKIKRDIKHLKELVERLREKKKSEEQISLKFKEEFSKLVSFSH